MRFILSVILMLSSSFAWAEDTLRAASTPAGQPASGLNSSTGKWEGLAVELLTELLKSRQIEFLQMNFSELEGALTSSKVDVIAASYGITPERAKVVDFSTPYGNYRDVLLVPETDGTAYQTLADFKGKRIATSRGSAYVKPLSEAGADVTQTDNPVASIGELKANHVDGVVDNVLQLRYRVTQMNLMGYKLVNSYAPIVEGKLAFAVRKGNADLLSTLNAALAQAEQNGTLKQLKTKWSVD